MKAQIKRRNGFTLIELLVVIAIIALLLSIILPSLNAVRELASGVVCMNNQKSLSTAWTLYAENNNDNLVGGSTYNTGARPTPYRWVEPPMTQPIYGGTRAPLGLSLTQEQRLNGIRAGKLFDYIGSEDIYHCPGDKTFLNPEPYAVYRSYAITGLMNGEHFPANARVPNNEFGRITNYWQYNGKNLKVAEKRTDIRTPGDKIVFAEEDVVKSKSGSAQQEYNKGSFVLLHTNMSWWDAPAGFHKEGGTFGFADGHAERKKWQNRNTLNLIENATPDPAPATNEDLLWLAQRYIPVP